MGSDCFRTPEQFRHWAIYSIVHHVANPALASVCRAAPAAGCGSQQLSCYPIRLRSSVIALSTVPASGAPFQKIKPATAAIFKYISGKPLVQSNIGWIGSNWYALSAVTAVALTAATVLLWPTAQLRPFLRQFYQFTMGWIGLVTGLGKDCRRQKIAPTTLSCVSFLSLSHPDKRPSF